MTDDGLHHFANMTPDEVDELYARYFRDVRRRQVQEVWQKRPKRAMKMNHGKVRGEILSMKANLEVEVG